jgi:hypothetical protein
LLVLLNYIQQNRRMKNALWLFTAVLLVQIIASINVVDVHSNNAGANAGYTGSPNEFNTRTCASQNGGCHSGGGSTFQQGMITSNVPECGYTPGQTYTITLTVSSPGRSEFGFSVSPQLDGGATAGSMISSTGTQLNGSGRYLTHTAAGTSESSPNTRVWTFSWIAPSAGSGNVTFYAAFNASNNNNGSSGDLIFNSNLTIFEGLQPEPPAIFGNSTACIGSIVNLSTNYSNGIVWSPGNQSSQAIETTTPGTYQVTVTNECGTSTSAPFDLSFEPIPPTPTIDFDIFSNRIESDLIGDYIYAWYIDGVLVPDSVSSSIYVTVPGIYTATASSASGCESLLSQPFNTIVISVNDFHQEPTFDFYPNPSTGEITIYNNLNSNLSIVMLDEIGREVQSFTLLPGPNFIPTLASPGVYFLSSRNSVVRKLIVF